MSDFAPRGGRGRRQPPIATRSAPAPVPDGDLTAEMVFKIPTVDEVIAAGYPRERHEIIKAEALEYRKRFKSDPAFRASVIEEYKRWQNRDKTTMP